MRMHMRIKKGQISEYLGKEAEILRVAPHLENGS